MNRLLAAAALLLSLSLGLPAWAQAQFTTQSSGQLVPGGMLMNPCGPITNGSPSACPNGPINPLYVNVTNATSATGVIDANSNVVNGTLSVTNTFQSVLGANSVRKGCTLWNTGSHTEYVSVAASPTIANSAPVLPGNRWSCQVDYGGVVRTDAVQIAGTSGDTFAGDWQ